MNKPTDGHLDARRLDLQRLADAAAALDGQWPLADLPRLTADAAPAGDAQVHWHVTGERRAVAGGSADPWLHLRARTTVRLTCQRCLQPVDEALAVARSFRFVADEAEAERLDELAEEEDVLALPPRGRLDLLPLVEDELILALPLVPRHEVCPEPLPLPEDEPEAAPAEHPFAALAALKQRKR
jgi:uncharacterized protein